MPLGGCPTTQPLDQTTGLHLALSHATCITLVSLPSLLVLAFPQLPNYLPSTELTRASALYVGVTINIGNLCKALRAAPDT